MAGAGGRLRLQLTRLRADGVAGDGIGADSPAEPVRESDVAAPADMIALGDNVSSDVHRNLTIVIGAIGRSLEDVHATPGTSAWTKRRRTHSGVVNVVFCDGHLEGNNIGQLYLDRSPLTVAGQGWPGHSGATTPASCHRVLIMVTLL